MTNGTVVTEVTDSDVVSSRVSIAIKRGRAVVARWADLATIERINTLQWVVVSLWDWGRVFGSLLTIVTWWASQALCWVDLSTHVTTKGTSWAWVTWSSNTSWAIVTLTASSRGSGTFTARGTRWASLTVVQ
jgi:hypothetical protein